MSVKDDRDVIIPLYTKAIEELKEDLMNVKNEETKTLILEELERCKKRLEFIEAL